MKSKWEFYNPYDLDLTGEMMRSIRVPRSVARVLFNRGLNDVDEVRRFLYSDTKDLHDPFLMRDMDEAVNRLIRALREKETIMIFGDYDVDGITSISLLYLFLKDLCGSVSYYVPDRSTEGYGLSIDGVIEAKNRGCSLIITVDCGITSVAEVAKARELGIDVIVSDHHEPGESLPEASAVVDPKRADCDYPFKELAGVGVAYKLAEAVVQRLEMESIYVERYLDLVAIGSAADIVPLKDENRVFVKVGLERLNREGQEGIMTLLETAGFTFGQVDVGQIVFGLAPRINAVGRLGKADPAVELLITRNHLQAVRIAKSLEEENRRRKEIDTQTLNEALEKIDSEFVPDDDSVIVLAGDNWHPGVIGIVASRLIERYYRPTIMITIEDGVGKGSARSIPNFDIHSALKSCSDLLLQFGGHKYAAGLTIDAGQIPEFKRRFNETAKSMLIDGDLIPKIKIDDELSFDEISTDLIDMLNKLEPFGPGNSRPCFVSYGTELVGEPRIVGKRHLKFKLRQRNTVLDAIAFNRAEDIDWLRSDRVIDVVYYIVENNWNGRNSIQLKIKDMK